MITKKLIRLRLQSLKRLQAFSPSPANEIFIAHEKQALAEITKLGEKAYNQKLADIIARD